MTFLSYICSGASLAAMIISSLLKGKSMRGILLLVLLANIMMAMSYVFAGQAGGAVSCFIGAGTALINNFYDMRGKKLPVWLIGIYAAAFVGANLAVFSAPKDILAIVASIAFILCIGQKSGRMYRFWTLVNMVLWCTYDALGLAFGTLVSHLIQLGFTVVGMLVHDRKKK